MPHKNVMLFGVGQQLQYVLFVYAWPYQYITAQVTPGNYNRYSI